MVSNPISPHGNKNVGMSNHHNASHTGHHAGMLGGSMLVFFVFTGLILGFKVLVFWVPEFDPDEYSPPFISGV